MAVLGRFSDFIKSIPSGWGAGYPTREEAVKIYLSTGGLLKMDHSSAKEPRILYPDARRINAQLRDIEHKKEYYAEQLRFWERTDRSLNSGSIVSGMQAIADPLYWEHLVKFAVSQDYKKAFKTVQPPIDKMRDRKWRRMMRMFLRSPEYRERLVEARTSILGRKRGPIRKTAEKADTFKKEVVAERIAKLRKERDTLVRKGKALKVLLEWVTD
jgi:hypothetical protein